MTSISSCAVFLSMFVLLCTPSVFSSYPKLRSNGSLDFGPSTPKTYDSVIMTEFDDEGLGAWYDLVLSFIQTVQSDPLPIDTIQTYIDSGAPGDFGAIWEQWSDFELPVLITVGIGFLFMLLMPLVGCCFCCCRLCKNCGGEMVQKKSSNTSCKRTAFTACLFIIFLFMFCSVIVIFVCNERITTSVKNTQQFSNDAFTESDKFIKKVINEIKDVTDEDFSEVITLLDYQLNDTGIKIGLGDKLLDKLKASVEKPVIAVQDLSKAVVKLQGALEVMVNNTETLQTLSSTLSGQLNDVKQDIDDCKVKCSYSDANDIQLCGGIDTSSLAQDANFTALENVSSQLTEINDVVSQNFSGKAEKGYKDFLGMSDRIVTESKGARDTVRNTLHDIKSNVGNFSQDITGKFNNVTTDLNKYKTDINNIFEDWVKPYDQYRWYAGIASTCILLLVVVLVGLGMMCGICGYDKEAMPSARSTVSNMGGNSLMAATAFLFLISFPIMLCTSLGFLLGFHYQKFCDPILDDQVLTWVSEGKFGELKVFGNSTLDLKAAIDGCRANKAIYNALSLENSPDLDIKKMFNVSKLVGSDFDSQIDKLNVNLNDTTILPSEVNSSLTDLKSGTVQNIAFDEFINETSKAIVKIDLNALADNLTEIASNLKNATVAKCFNDSAAKLRSISATTVADMKAKADELGTNVNSIKSIGSSLSIKAGNVLKEAEAAESYVQTNVSQDVKQATKEYGDTLLNTVTSFVDYVFGQITENVGHCKTIGDVYDGLVNVLCKEFTYPVNGWWAAAGWCAFFFIPCIIFCVKLAKHYRRMDYEDGFDEEMGNEAYPMSTRANNQGVGPERKMWTQGGGYH